MNWLKRSQQKRPLYRIEVFVADGKPVQPDPAATRTLIFSRSDCWWVPGGQHVAGWMPGPDLMQQIQMHGAHQAQAKMDQSEQGKWSTPMPPEATPATIGGMPAMAVRLRADLFDEIAGYARSYFANLRGVTGGNFLLVVSIFEEES